MRRLRRGDRRWRQASVVAAPLAYALNLPLAAQLVERRWPSVHAPLRFRVEPHGPLVAGVHRPTARAFRLQPTSRAP